jgi:hypothetical protein
MRVVLIKGHVLQPALLLPINALLAGDANVVVLCGGINNTIWQFDDQFW